MEFAAHGITVNNIPPGFVDTPMLRSRHFDFDATASQSPMRRPAPPLEEGLWSIKAALIRRFSKVKSVPQDLIGFDLDCPQGGQSARAELARELSEGPVPQG